MNIALDIRPIDQNNKSQHKVRGVGKYITLLKNNLEKYDKKNNYLFNSRPGSVSADIVHYPYFDPFFPILPFRENRKTVVTVHDLIPLKYNKEFPVGMKGNLKWQINKRLLKKTQAIIVDSNASAKDVHDICGIDSDKIHTVYLSADEEFKKLTVTEEKKKLFLEEKKLPENFFLYVGDVTWNKNLPRLVDAVKKSGVTIVMVGKALTDMDFDHSNAWNKDRIQVQKATYQDDRFIKLGFVPTEDLVMLYNIAKALIIPSIDEGFGLPALEAMRSGCPVISSKLGSLPEVCGNAALYADALSVEDIAAKIMGINSDENQRRDLIEKGRKQADLFSLKKMVEETVRVYESL